MTSPDFPLGISPEQDRLIVKSEDVVDMNAQIDGERAKFAVWREGVTGCQCPQHQGFARREMERVKNEVGEQFGVSPLPLPHHMRRPMLSYTVTQTLQEAERRLKEGRN